MKCRRRANSSGLWRSERNILLAITTVVEVDSTMHWQYLDVDGCRINWDDLGKFVTLAIESVHVCCHDAIWREFFCRAWSRVVVWHGRARQLELLICCVTNIQSLMLIRSIYLIIFCGTYHTVSTCCRKPLMIDTEATFSSCVRLALNQSCPEGWACLGHL